MEIQNFETVVMINPATLLGVSPLPVITRQPQLVLAEG